MKYLSVCSGIEAASVAWKHLGWEAVGYSEIEPFPCAVLAHHFPNTPNYGSLTEYANWPVQPGAIDLLVGGTPCQSFSVAGLRKGMQDPRGNLTLTYLALADKLKPKWIVYENVPGLLSINGGRDLGAFLGALGQLGYGVAYRVLDAQHFGVPQRRRRVFVVARLGNWEAAAEVLSIAEGLRGHIEAGGKKRKATPSDAGAGAEAGSILWNGSDQANTLNNFDLGDTRTTHALVSHFMPGTVAPTVTSSGPPYSRTGNERVECEALAITTHAAGLAIPYRKSKRASSTTDNETWVEAGASNTLNNFDLGDTRTTHAVVTPAPIAFTQNQREEVRLLGDMASTLSSQPGTHQQTYIAFQPGNLVRKAGADPSTETFPTLTKDLGDQSPHVATAMAVRRLTLMECERLQGFPDNWTQIPWRGKPAEDCPDGPRYKACGNSMAVPVMRWIGEQIAHYEAAKDGKPSA